MIEDVKLSDITIVHSGGRTKEDAQRQLGEKEKEYPEPNMFGELNASAFFIRHVKGLEMHHIDVTFEKADARPAFVMEDVSGADVFRLKTPAGGQAFRMKAISDFRAMACRGLKDTVIEKAAEQNL